MRVAKNVKGSFDAAEKDIKDVRANICHEGVVDIGVELGRFPCPVGVEGSLMEGAAVCGTKDDIRGRRRGDRKG